jgi:hypothetical protein
MKKKILSPAKIVKFWKIVKSVGKTSGLFLSLDLLWFFEQKKTFSLPEIC